jgi:hypothetical protein
MDGRCWIGLEEYGWKRWRNRTLAEQNGHLSWGKQVPNLKGSRAKEEEEEEKEEEEGGGGREWEEGGGEEEEGEEQEEEEKE